MASKKKTKITLSVGSALAMMAGAALFAPAAHAALVPPSSCPQGYVCNYKDANFQIQMTSFQYEIPEYSAFDMHDKISSVANNGRVSNARLYKNNFYKGDSFLLLRGEADGDLSNSVGAVTVSGFNDQIDSGKFV